MKKIFILIIGLLSLSIGMTQIAPQTEQQSSFLPKPKGTFSFGEGIGPDGRYPVKIVEPDVTKESLEKAAKTKEPILITFRFTISPDGSVGKIYRPVSQYPELARIGMKAIRKWKFTPDPDAGILKTSVVIKFILD